MDKKNLSIHYYLLSILYYLSNIPVALLVETAAIEAASENPSIQLSSGGVVPLKFPYQNAGRQAFRLGILFIMTAYENVRLFTFTADRRLMRSRSTLRSDGPHLSSL